MKEIKFWTNGMPVEESAREQLTNLSKLDIVYPHIAVMPDVHYGIGATVGSVVPTVGAIIPAAVGVDIGCGMNAIRTSLRAEDLPDSLANLRLAIEAAIPVGKEQHVGMSKGRQALWDRNLAREYEELCKLYPQIVAKGVSDPALQVGTLGGGNHFVEVCLDEEQRVWLMLHSGSRGIGNRIGTHFISEAKEECLKNHRALPHGDLAYLAEGSLVFRDYIRAIKWAQLYATANREAMQVAALAAMSVVLPPFSLLDKAISCHHNYVGFEHHYGRDLYVTRKGAVHAGFGELGIIPGSMGAKSFIVRGKGNAESLCSCSHGAGRKMSRGEAKRRITLEEHAQATAGVECRKDEGVLDESPAAYKSIDEVMEAQKDLVSIEHTLKQVLCVKG